MALSTRSHYYPALLDASQGRHEYNTPAKTRFYNALDQKDASTSFRAFAKRNAPSYTTARRWRDERTLLGSPSYRKARKQSQRIGRPPIIDPSVSRMLVNPAKNPVREQALEAQLKFHDINAHPKTLSKALLRDTRAARKYKQAYVGKKISAANREKRVSYGERHKGKSIAEFWSHIFFTDEAHIDPTASSVGWILREQGTRYAPENIQERGELSSNKLHFAAWVNWYGKAEKLEFYHDEEERTERPKRLPKPRKSKYKDNASYQQRLTE